MGKLSRSTNKQNRDTSPQFILNVAYKKETSSHSTIISFHISRSPLMIGYAFLGNILSHMCKGKEDRFLLIALTSVDRAAGRLLTALTWFADVFWLRFGWGISVFAGHRSGHKNRGNLTSPLTSVDCHRADCRVYFRWPILTGHFRTVLGWLDLLLEAEVDWVWLSWIKEEFYLVDQRWRFWLGLFCCCHKLSDL